MLPRLSRRHFLVAMAGAVASTRGRPLAAGAVVVDTLRIGLVPGDADATLGARLGVDEGARAASLFGAGVELLVDADPRALLGAGATAIVGGRDDAECARLVALTGEGSGIGRALCLDVGATGDALRAACRAHAFHVAASDAMRRAARATSAEAGGADGEITLWHASLEKYGAAQLNDRFWARFGRAMTPPAWAAWMAVKVVVEATLRARGTDPAALAAYLTRPGVRFDGHKGRPLTFGVRDHQLRQPLYLVHPGAGRAEEIPERAGGDAEPRVASGCTLRA